MEQEDREQRAKREEAKQLQEQEKRERRKSQLHALKAAMTEIKHSEPPPTTPRHTSLQKAAILGKSLSQTPPTQILSRHSKSESRNEDHGRRHREEKEKGEGPSTAAPSQSRDNRVSHQSEGNLRPDGTVVFCSQERTEDDNQGLPLTTSESATTASIKKKQELADDVNGRSLEASREDEASKDLKWKHGKNKFKGGRGHYGHEARGTYDRTKGIVKGQDGRGHNRAAIDGAGHADLSEAMSKDIKGKNKNTRGGGRGRGRHGRGHGGREDPSSYRSRGERGRGKSDKGGSPSLESTTSRGRGRGRGRDHSRGRGRGHSDGVRGGRTGGSGGRGRGGRGRGGGKASRGGQQHHNYEIGKT